MKNKLQNFFKGLFMDMETEKTDKEIANDVKEIKMNAELATEKFYLEETNEVSTDEFNRSEAKEDLIDDESEDGLDAEDVDDNQGEIFTEDELMNSEAEEDYLIDHAELMRVCEEKVNSCNEQGLKDLFAGTKKFYEGATCEETKNTIALKINSRIFELIQ